MSDWWNQPMRVATPEPEAAQGGGCGASCPWCSAIAEPGASCCPGCGAVMAQRESLGGMVIPGVTQVDPGMTQPSLTSSLLGTQARMNMLSAVGYAAGPSAKLVTAAAMLARDSMGGMLVSAQDPASVGRSSQAALAMAALLNEPGRQPYSPAAETSVAGDDPSADEAPSDEPA